VGQIFIDKLPFAGYGCNPPNFGHYTHFTDETRLIEAVAAPAAELDMLRIRAVATAADAFCLLG
jgi:hypothetical protein